MEKDTVMISTDRYLSLIFLEKGINQKKVLVTKLSNNYNTLYCQPSYSVFNNSAVTANYYTEEEIVKELTEEIKTLREDLEKELLQRHKIEVLYTDLLYKLKNMTYFKFLKFKKSKK